MKEIAGFRYDVGHVAGPDGDRKQHDVHGGETRHGKALEKPLRAARFFLDQLRTVRVSPIAETLEFADDRGGGKSAILPLHGQTMCGAIETRIHDATQATNSTLYLVDGSESDKGCGFVGGVALEIAVQPTLALVHDERISELGEMINVDPDIARIQEGTGRCGALLMALDGVGRASSGWSA